jgi:hypothetical protein
MTIAKNVADDRKRGEQEFKDAVTDMEELLSGTLEGSHANKVIKENLEKVKSMAYVIKQLTEENFIDILNVLNKIELGRMIISELYAKVDEMNSSYEAPQLYDIYNSAISKYENLMVVLYPEDISIIEGEVGNLKTCLLILEKLLEANNEEVNNEN